jgi:hypothetical protein
VGNTCLLVAKADNVAVLKDMLAEAKRLQDIQHDAIDQLDAKTIEVAKLAIVLFAFGVGILATFNDTLEGSFRDVFCGILVMLAGFGFNVGALVLLAHSYSSLTNSKHEAESIPSLKWLNEQAGLVLGSGFSETTYYDALLGGHAEADKKHEALMDQKSLYRSHALRCMAFSFGLFLVGALYLAATSILL